MDRATPVSSKNLFVIANPRLLICYIHFPPNPSIHFKRGLRWQVVDSRPIYYFAKEGTEQLVQGFEQLNLLNVSVI
jgi:hypothetical protein